MHIVEVVFEDIETWLDWVRHRLDWLAGWRIGWKFGCWKRVSMDERVPGRTSLDLAQANQIAAFEVAISVLELPKWWVWRASVEDIAHCASVSTKSRCKSSY
jgi:hypothetical protein